jgi:farnesyl-diphosphate farnesyltransferase
MDATDLLQKTSRTFALAIPMLPEPTRNSVTLAYLLMRVIDTFEDATTWSKQRKLTALGTVAEVLRRPAREWREGGVRVARLAEESPPSTHTGYLELLATSPQLFEACSQLPERPRSIVACSAFAMAEGMARFVERSDDNGCLTLETLVELREYCFVAAGLVGELLTELFLHDVPSLQPAAATLRETMNSFAEGLQLVNIVKDASDDTKAGRAFLPEAMSRAQVIELARSDLKEASRYVVALQQHRAPLGTIAFTGLSLVLARRTLDALERGEPKLSRAEVTASSAALTEALEAQVPLEAFLDGRPVEAAVRI